MTARTLFALSVLLGACASPEEQPPQSVRPGRAPATPAGRPVVLSLDDLAPAPALALPYDGGTFDLAAQRGQLVVLTFADGEALAQVLAPLVALADDLVADEAVVAVITPEVPAGFDAPLPLLADADGAAARAFGAGALPLTVVVDRNGLVRGRHRGVPTQAAVMEIVDLVLVEDEPALPADLDLALTPIPPAEVHALVADGAVLVDVRPAAVRVREGTVDGAAALPLADLGPDDLPANLGVPLIFVASDTEDARRAAEQAHDWGYSAVFLVDGGPDDLRDARVDRVVG